MLDNQANAGAQLDARGHRRNRTERDKRIERVGVLAREFAATGPRRLALRRDVGVFGQEHRLEAMVFRSPAEIGHRDRVFGRKYRYAKVHTYPSNSWLASFAPSANARNLAHMMDGGTRRSP